MFRSAVRRLFSTEEPLIITSNHNYVCQVKLNKPKALNSLCIPMIGQLQKELLDWNGDSNVRVVLFMGSGKAFCAGGDIRALYDAKRVSEDKSVLSNFFWNEYICDYAIAKMNPIQICLYDGVVMGGGVGISIHAPIRIATENAIFAMPETAIGLFPDVGGSYFLPRLEDYMGLYLGVTGSRLTGSQLVQAGIATHYVPKEKIDDLKDSLIENTGKDASLKDVEEIVSSFSQSAESVIPEIKDIERCFSKVNSVEHVYHKLDEDGSDWAKKKLESFEKLSPLSLHVVFEQLKRGRNLTLEEVFTMEYRMSQRFMNGHDFFEGVRAALIEKDKNPKWQHESVFEVPDELVDSYFEKLTPESEDLDVQEELKKLLGN